MGVKEAGPEMLQEFVSEGVYGLPETARLLKTKRSTVQRWAFGYRRAGRSYEGAIRTHLPQLEGRYAVTFLELVELFTIREFREAGATWPQIRSTFEFTAERFDTDYPFALQRWFADAAGIYYMEGEDGPFVEASLHGQVALREALLPYLRQLDFDLEGIAERWYPLGKHRPVVIDPELSFGAPVVAGTSIRTATLAGMAEQGETPESLAWWYDLSHAQVDAALEYEGSLSA